LCVCVSASVLCWILVSRSLSVRVSHYVSPSKCVCRSHCVPASVFCVYLITAHVITLQDERIIE